VGPHVSLSDNRFEVPEPIRRDVRECFGYLRDTIIRGQPMDGLSYRLAIRIAAASSMPSSPTWTV
jgi:hypothetical protein